MSLIVFIFGLCVGSFLNVIIYRLPRGEKISGRSRCPHCQTKIAWYDLIPVFSFIFLGGKCRYCHRRISFQYPLVEIFTGILFVLTTYNFQNLIQLIYWLFIVCCLLVIFVVDLRHYIIPDRIIYPAIAIALIFNFFTPTPNFGVGASFLIFNQFSIFNYSILSAFGAAIFFLLIVLISNGKWMGFGDVKLAFFMGLFLGWPGILVALFLAFLLGAIIGLGLVAFGKKKLKEELPFGPFLVTGTFIALFLGQNLINWYLDLII